jgi:hypothetical protein
MEWSLQMVSEWWSRITQKIPDTKEDTAKGDTK